jgi:tetratricopeptide (TPR) repeat protein
MKDRLLFLLAVHLTIPGGGAFASGQDAVTGVKALISRAEELAKARDLDGAIGLLDKAIQSAPDNDVLLGAISDFEFKAGRFASGLKHARKAVALQPAKGAYYCLAAVNAYGEQDVAKCREYCKVVLDQPKKFEPGPVLQARFREDLLLDKTFTFFFKLDPRKGRLVGGAFALGLPKTGLPYQKTSYEISGVRSHRLARGQSDDVLHVVPRGTEPFPLTIKVTVKPYSFKQALAQASRRSLPPEALANLGPIVGINPKSPVLRKVVSGLKGKDTVASVRNIQAWLSKNIEYKLQIASFREVDFKSVDEIVKRGYAECQGYAMLFTGLCRAAGIPARPVWGLMRVPPGVDRKFGDIVSHNWAEFYVPGCGWVPIDPQRFETLGFLPNHYVRMFTGSQKNANSTEAYPLFNLLSMHDAKIRFEERAESRVTR